MPDVCDGVVRERDAGRAALLRTVMHEAVLADIEVARTGAAFPLVGPAIDQVVLEIRQTAVAALGQRLDTLIYPPLVLAQRL